MRRRAILLLMVTAMVLALASGIALAADREDQKNTIPTGQGRFHDDVSQGANHAQTFTAGLTGKLDQVSVYLTPNTSDPNHPGKVIAEIYPTDSSGSPKTSGNPLEQGSFSVPGNAAIDSFGWMEVKLSQRAPVVKGGVYALVVRAVYDQADPGFAGSLFWKGANGEDNYAKGDEAESTDNGTTWNLVSGSDYFFKTFVVKR